MSSRNPEVSRRRTCREEKSFEDDLARLTAKYPCIQNVCDDMTWELSRNPEVGAELAGDPDYRIFHTTAYGNTPSFRVLYSFDDDMVYLWAIEPTGEATDDS
jgi:hypothetical protein